MDIINVKPILQISNASTISGMNKMGSSSDDRIY
jgi:hypothetical protein